MSFKHTHYLDIPNKLVIFQAEGEEYDPEQIENFLKAAIQLTHNYHFCGILLDMRELVVAYDKSSMLDIFIRMRDEDWLGDLRIARYITEKGNFNQLIGDICQKYNLPIRNFTLRNQALSWLVHKL
ncbi:MAG: hypothetical protein ACJA13_000988 [Paraglaciecola sp.]|jgi:hypothetical protein